MKKLGLVHEFRPKINQNSKQMAEKHLKRFGKKTTLYDRFWASKKVSWIIDLEFHDFAFSKKIIG